MKKAYDSRIEEAVEAHFRHAQQLGLLRKIKWFGLIASPIIFLLVSVFLDDPAAKLVVGGSAALLYIPFHLSSYQQQYRKRIHKMLVKALGTDQPVPSEFEVDDHGLAFRRQGQESRFSWASVQSLKNTDDYIELTMQPTGIAVIPKRIFADPAELQTWLVFMEEHRASKATDLR